MALFYSCILKAKIVSKFSRVFRVRDHVWKALIFYIDVITYENAKFDFSCKVPSLLIYKYWSTFLNFV